MVQDHDELGGDRLTLVERREREVNLRLADPYRLDPEAEHDEEYDDERCDDDLEPGAELLEVFEEGHAVFVGPVRVGCSPKHKRSPRPSVRGLMDFPQLSERITVLGQWVGRVTVSANLPVAEFLLVREGHGPDPFCALVRVALRDQ